MKREEILEGLAKATIEGDAERAKQLAEEALKAGIDPYDAIMKGCAEGMKVVSDLYEKGEMFVPEILLSAEAMYAAIDVLKPHLKVEKVGKTARVVIGVVEGDIHDIGKNLVKIMMEAAGFQILDLGRDVPKSQFVEKAKEFNANVVAMSTLMTTTMGGMKDVIRLLEEAGMRDKVRVIVGGAPLSPEFAKSIGADAYGKDATEAVKIVSSMI